MNYKNILFIANNFGFGPISRCHTIAAEISKLNPELNIIIITDGKSVIIQRKVFPLFRLLYAHHSPY